MAEKQAAVPEAGSSTKLIFGCFGGVCVPSPDPYPLHLGPPGTQVYIYALNSNVDIKFTGKSPFESKEKNFTIAQGTFTGPEIVAAAAPGGDETFGFTVKCGSCPTPSGGPEMIVP